MTNEAAAPPNRQLVAGRRDELGAFLRARRERTQPVDVGVPVTRRRRTPGLRREELAFLAGISTTWYTYLEQGRDVRPSEQVLRAIATALGLSPVERDHLLVLAGAIPPLTLTAVEAVGEHTAALLRLLAHQPAYVTGIAYDVLAATPPAVELFGGLGDLAGAPGPAPAGGDGSRPPVNLVRWVLTHPAARQVLVDWEGVAQDLLARLRAKAVRHPQDARFTTLVTDLHRTSAHVRAWWPRHDVRADHSGTKRLNHPRLGPITLTHASFTPAETPDQTLVVYDDPLAPSAALPGTVMPCS